MKIHLVHLNLPIFEQLQLEEALLRTDTRNWCLINQNSPPAIVMGISGKQELLIHPDNQLPVIRRFSGGGTVVVDENTLFVTWICNTSDTVEGFPDRIFKWTESLYKNLFTNLPFALRENDYVLGDRKFGGNAQYIRKDRWLHHSTLLWSYNKERMNSLLLPQKAPKYREQRPHDDFLCSLDTFYTCRQTFLKSLSELCNQFEVEHVDLAEALHVLKSPHRTSTTILS